MRYILFFFVTATLFSCNSSPTGSKAGNLPASTKLVTYINNTAISQPGWDNNDITKSDMLSKLCKGFDKHILDSNLLDGYAFQLENIKPTGKAYQALFKPLQATGNVLVSDMPIKFEIYSILSDSLARSLKQNDIYIISMFTKDLSDSSYIPSSLPLGFSLDGDYSHNITKCDLGQHSIQIISIKPFN